MKIAKLRMGVLLCFPIAALILVMQFVKIPEGPNWLLILFLAFTAVLDRIHTKVFSSYGYSFSIVILGLLIFDVFSILYSLVYFFFSYLVLYLKRKPNFWFVLLPLCSIQLISLIIGNEFYNFYTAKDYIARYETLSLLLVLNIVLYYFAIACETGKFTTSIFLSIFGPVLFELFVIFPFLSFFDQFHYFLISVIFLTYYIFVGIMHKKYLTISEHHVQALIQKLNPRRELEVLFMDIGSLKGICNPGRKMIIIDEKMDFPEQLQTLVHEWIHFKLWKKHRLIKPVEELVVTLLEAAISWYYILTIHRLLAVQIDKENPLKWQVNKK